MAAKRHEINVAVPDVWSGPVTRRTMIKGASLMAALFGAPGLLAACGGSTESGTSTGESGNTVAPEAEKVLNFYNWTAYIDDTSNAPDVPKDQLTIPKFEAETGIKVNYSTYSDNAELVAKISSGGSGFDLVVPTDYIVKQLIEAKKIRKLDQSKLGNVSANLDDSFKNLFYDPNLEYSVPWGRGNTGIGINKAVVTKDVRDASIFGDTDYAGQMSILSESHSTIPLALLYLGLDPQTSDPGELDKAFAQLGEWKANATITSDYQDALGAGDFVVSHAYSGDVYQQITSSGKDLQYIIPTQGADQYVDSLVILGDAPHPGNAHEFMNFVYEPAVSANLMEAIHYRNANKAAYAMLPAELRENPVVFPPPDVQERLIWVDLDEATTTLWNNRWDEFTGGES